MYAIILLLMVAVLSLLITRIATVALTVTGMTRESARFQARSALTGAGFTTHESEAVVSHPVRRRIVMALSLLGKHGASGHFLAVPGGGQEPAQQTAATPSRPTQSFLSRPKVAPPMHACGPTQGV